MRKRIKNNTGVSLVEIMVAAVVMVLTFVGLLISYVRCMDLSEVSRNSAAALTAVKSRMEQIKNTDFNQIVTNYNGITFTDAGLDGIGVSYVDDITPDLLQVTITFCFRLRSNRVIGEDTDLDGQVDLGEDVNANTILDSPVQIVSMVYDG